MPILLRPLAYCLLYGALVSMFIVFQTPILDLIGTPLFARHTPGVLAGSLLTVAIIQITIIEIYSLVRNRAK